MREITSSPFFGITLCIFTYTFYQRLQHRFHTPLLNPMLWTVVTIIAVLQLFGIPIEDFNQGGDIISLFLSPATAVLAVSIFNQLSVLKKNLLPILGGCFVGAVTSITSVILLSKAFGLEEQIQTALIPKSVTTPIAMAVSEQMGGLVPVTVAAVVVTGIIGCVCTPFLLRVLRIKDPVTAGIAIGACSHALGTTKAIEISETHGAMSGIAIGMSGILTVLITLFL